MKFLVNHERNHNPMMRLLLIGLQIFTVLFLCFDILYKSEQVGLSYAAALTYLFGSEAEFIEAVPLSTLLELLHADTFFAMMILLSLGSIYARLCSSKTRALYMVNIVMLTALIAILSPLAALYVADLFIWFWLVTFWCWHVGAVMMSVEVLWRLRRS